jgi:hypothetical protein
VCCDTFSQTQYQKGSSGGCMCLFLLLSAHALLLSRIHTSPALCSSLWDLKSCQSQKIYAASCWPTDDIEVIFAPDLCARLHGSRKLLLLIVSKIGLLTDHMDSSTSFKVTRFPKKKKKSYRSLNHTTVSSGVRLADVKVISASAFFFANYQGSTVHIGVFTCCILGLFLFRTM